MHCIGLGRILLTISSVWSGRFGKSDAAFTQYSLKIFFKNFTEAHWIIFVIPYNVYFSVIHLQSILGEFDSAVSFHCGNANEMQTSAGMWLSLS